MTRIIEKPKLVHYAVSHFTRSTLEEIELYSQKGVLGVWLEDCMTDMISSQHFCDFNMRYIRRITEYARSKNLSTFHYFCGDPKSKWKLLLDTGADALSVEESKKAFTIDIEDIVEQVDGHMTVLGNLDAIKVLEQASDEELIAEIKRQISAGHRNNHRFIMSLGSPVTPGTTVKRVQDYISYAHTIGKG
jgi:uroporphyrinogen-III decarboxylase